MNKNPIRSSTKVGVRLNSLSNLTLYKLRINLTKLIGITSVFVLTGFVPGSTFATIDETKCNADTFAGLTIPGSDPDAANVTGIGLKPPATRNIPLTPSPITQTTGAGLITSPTLGTYCRVTGEIYTWTPTSSDPTPSTNNVSTITFEVRLPSTWNGDYMQYGGGNLDGNLTTNAIVLGPPPGFFFFNSTANNAPLSATYSSSGGYVISAADAGHVDVCIRPASSDGVIPPSLTAENGMTCASINQLGTIGAAFINSDGTQNVDRWLNFSYRSRHLQALVAKDIIQRYYNTPPLYSFHSGGSSGGRNSLIAAQRYPKDFDGIIASSPATNPGSVASWVATSQKQFPGTNSNGDVCDVTHLSNCLKSQVIPTAGADNVLPLIHKATMAACEARDGLVDGIISDPANCNFDPLTDSNLPTCPADKTQWPRDPSSGLPLCLSAEQKDVLKTLYSPVTVSGMNVVVLGGNPGYEADSAKQLVAHQFGATPTTSRPASYVNVDEFTRSFIYNDQSLTLQTLNLANQGRFFVDWMECGSGFISPPCSLFDPDVYWPTFDLTEFLTNGGTHGNGGKMLIPQGQLDVILPGSALYYYNGLVSQMGGLDQTRQFARMFLIPGKGHSAFTAAAGAPAIFNYLTPIETWVKSGVAPDSILGSNTLPLPITRPICAYPFKAVYTGPSGDTVKMRDAANFQCRYYNFKGFLNPVDGFPTINLVKGGQAVPVKFSLGSNWGLNIFAVGYPKTEVISCDSTTPVDGTTAAEEVSNLKYDSNSDTYTYLWKPSKTLSGTCQQLVIRLNEGTTLRANFNIK